ncbi:MAG: 4'-phosphopantetheinyl transferase superfamily protein [Patescibacteria group bacterium]|nr:4'-phosphopantetheinyl transferase superfamily protein [Patescibacteria group bacterium]
MNNDVLKDQRATVHSMVYELTGKKLRHLRSGRPFVSRLIDVSVSHKGPIVKVKAVPAPYKIGIDVEWLKESLSEELFLGPVITEEEVPFLREFCRKHGFPLSSGIATFWSVKESFFKCLDHDLRPGKIRLADISGDGLVSFVLSDEIEEIMKKRRLRLCSVKVVIGGEYVYSETVMKRIR